MSRLTQLQKLRDASPDDPDLAYMLAHEHSRLGDAAGAVHWYDACLALDRGYHYAYFHKAKVLRGMGDADGALAALRAGLDRARSDGNAKAVNEIGALLNELGA